MMIYGTDLAQFYYWIEHYVRAIRSLSLQQLLWNPWNFLGSPFLFNLEYGALNPIMLFAPILGTANFINFEYVLSLAIAFLGSYLFVSSSLSLGKVSGLVAGLIFTFNGFTFPRIYAGHLNILTTYCWLPLSLYSMTSFVKTKKTKFLILWLATLCLQLTSGFVNIFIFSFVIQASWLGIIICKISGRHFSQLLKKRNIIIAIVFTAVFIFIYLNFSQVINESQRSMKASYVFSSSYSLPIKNLRTLIFPDQLGNPIFKDSRLFDQNYFGNFNYWELSGFVGLGTIFLVFMSLFSKSRYSIFFTVLFILGLSLSLGENTPIFRWFFNWFSFYRYIRIPSQHLVIFVFASSVLAGYGVNVLMKKKSTILFIFLCSLSLLSTAVTMTRTARNYFANRTDTFYSEDFGDLRRENIDESQMNNINLVGKNNWIKVNGGLISPKGTLDSSIVFDIPLSKFHVTEMVVDIMNEPGVTISYSDDKEHWTILDDANENISKKLKIRLPYHATIYKPFAKKMFIKISKNKFEDLVGIDKITIVSY